MGQMTLHGTGLLYMNHKMKKLILLPLFALSACTVSLQPQDDLVKVVNNQGAVLQEIIKVLQENKLLKQPEEVKK